MIVMIDGVIFGKLVDVDDVFVMFICFVGCEYVVLIVVVVIDVSGELLLFVLLCLLVCFVVVLCDVYVCYVEIGELFGKVGVYVIQGCVVEFIE